MLNWSLITENCTNYKKIIKLSDKNEDKLNELKSDSGKQRKTTNISSQLSKFLSPLYDSIFSGSRAGTRATRRKADSIFSDLCGFTDFVESVESEDVTHVLNLYLETMTNIALNYGATIDKYISDGIMLSATESKGIKEDALLRENGDGNARGLEGFPTSGLSMA